VAFKVGAWVAARKVLATASTRAKQAAKKAILQEAHFFRGKIVEGIREQAPGGQRFKPLAPMTLALRRFMGFKGTKALIRRGDLRNSITVHQTGNTVFVGVLKTATNRDGKSLVNIGAVHEFGSKPIVIRVTPAMRRFLHMVARKEGLPASGGSGGGGSGVIVLRIPKRPFLQPVFDKYGSKAQVAARMRARLAFLLSGKLSK
jgi:phage gpG-like protein